MRKKVKEIEDRIDLIIASEEKDLTLKDVDELNILRKDITYRAKIKDDGEFYIRRIKCNIQRMKDEKFEIEIQKEQERMRMNWEVK